MVHKRIAVIGGAGNVGIGITKAFRKRGWKVNITDPQINKTFEELNDIELKKIFSSLKHVVYSAEVGNRDLYTKNSNLGKENNLRFEKFCNTICKINPKITVWYIGGSWTKRKPNNNWLVTDNSLNKDLKDCIPYEKAKISAEKNAQKLSKLFNIRFLDWASIVPNLSENFSIPKMITQALKEGKITYSSSLYGRPLLESTQAGEALVYLIKDDNPQNGFQKFLIPGLFIPFREFANAVKKVVEKETDKIIKLEKQPTTPDFLKTKTHTNYLEKLGFRPKRLDILKALQQNASKYLRLVKENDKHL